MHAGFIFAFLLQSLPEEREQEERNTAGGLQLGQLNNRPFLSWLKICSHHSNHCNTNCQSLI